MAAVGEGSGPTPGEPDETETPFNAAGLDAVREVVAILRGERPEVNERLAEAGVALAAAAKAVLDAVLHPAVTDEPVQRAEPPAPRDVQQIDVQAE